MYNAKNSNESFIFVLAFNSIENACGIYTPSPPHADTKTVKKKEEVYWEIMQLQGCSVASFVLERKANCIISWISHWKKKSGTRRRSPAALFSPTLFFWLWLSLPSPAPATPIIFWPENLCSLKVSFSHVVAHKGVARVFFHHNFSTIEPWLFPVSTSLFSPSRD